MTTARLLADASLTGHVVRGLRDRHPHVDVVAAWEFGIHEWDDPRILAWAAANRRAVVARDRKTMIGFAYERVLTGSPMSGLVVVPDRYPVKRAVEDLAILVDQSLAEPLDGRVIYLPRDKAWRVSENEPDWAAAGA